MTNRRTSLKKRIAAILLTIVMGLSMTGYTFVEAFAEDGEQTGAEATMDGEEAPEAGAPDGNGTDGQTDADIQPEGDGQTDADTVDVEGSLDIEDPDAVPAEDIDEESLDELIEESEDDLMLLESQSSDLVEIKVRASRDGAFVTAMWTRVKDASYYMVYLNDDKSGYKVDAGDKCKYIFPPVSADTVVQTVKVEAYREKAAKEPASGGTAETGETAAPAPAGPEYEKFAEGSALTIDAVTIRTLPKNLNTGVNYMGLNLRTLLGEPNGGYAVAQGAATDGKYAYYVMASSSNQKGRILKINLTNKSDRKAGPEIGLHHANGMTYDSKRNVLVAVGYGENRHQLTFIDPVTLKITKQTKVKYSYAGKISGMANNAENNGIAAIAYVPKYDVYVARSRGKVSGYSNTTGSANNNIWVFDANTLEAVGHIFTRITTRYPETYQSMDADERYVYFLLSPGGKQKKNIILALDWNSENLLPVVNGDAKYVDHMWYCNNDGTGMEDAVITIPVSNESEGLFHTTDSNGNEHFYASVYYGRWRYKTVYQTKKYKVKWKKVRQWYNKKTKKWTTKKPAKKYRGKKRKVWKYKTKKKKVRKTVKDYWARDDYVYDLGVF